MGITVYLSVYTQKQADIVDIPSVFHLVISPAQGDITKGGILRGEESQARPWDPHWREKNFNSSESVFQVKKSGWFFVTRGGGGVRGGLTFVTKSVF